jgi:hypothetical protein
MTEPKRRPGRPRKDPRTAGTVAISTRLPVELDAKARRIGDGSLVEGIRRALREYPER